MNEHLQLAERVSHPFDFPSQRPREIAATSTLGSGGARVAAALLVLLLWGLTRASANGGENFGFDLPVTNPFGLQHTGAFQSNPIFLDLDGDGDLDVLAGQMLWYYENEGDPSNPSFAAPEVNPFGLAAPETENRPTSGDLDGDGDLDLLVGDVNGHLWYFQNTGSATSPSFAAPVNAPFGMTIELGSTARPDLGDIDGDGDLDLVVGTTQNVTEAEGRLVYFENQGSATTPHFSGQQFNPFGLAVQYSYPSPSLVDMDGDGDLDLLAGSIGGTFYYHENVGSANQPQYAAPMLNPFRLRNPGGYSSPTIADLDGDGDLDVLSGNFEGDLIFFENVGQTLTASFEPPLFNPFNLGDVGAPDNPMDGNNPTLVDLDGDDDLDLLVGTARLTLLYFQNTGTASSPNFAEPVSNPFGMQGYNTSPEVGDLDGDGDSDLLAIGYDEGEWLDHWTYFENTGNATHPAFAAPRRALFGLGQAEYANDPLLADLDGDGDLDLLAGGDSMVYYENVGSVSSPLFVQRQTQPFGLSAGSPSAADFDVDGDLDLLVGYDSSSGDLAYVENVGDARRPLFWQPRANPFGLQSLSHAVRPTVGDLDDDGDLDVLVGHNTGNFYYFEHTGLPIPSSRLTYLPLMSSRR